LGRVKRGIPGKNRIALYGFDVSLQRRPMFKAVFPLGIALASASLLPLTASAVPIKAADGVSTSVPNSQSGPRRPGLIRSTPRAGDTASQFSNRRGRPVPSLSKAADTGADQRARVAESVPSRAPRQL
jgi:hypothetical protein